ncbi:MAG TPA: helix-turn-helix transcriptional regulator [Streptosporangiaceae bacterium]|nr:helix-turn-helix transcriptional regulator [Streptosporangiaceae bacterium]
MSYPVLSDQIFDVTAHQMPDPEFCPFCGSPLDEGHSPAGDIVLKSTLPEPIADALRRVSALSPRELAVFELLGLGYDNRTLARMLHVSERTAKRHVTAILAKLGLKSRLQAGIAALLTASLNRTDPPGIDQ